LSLYRDAVLINFIVKALAKGDGVFVSVIGRQGVTLGVVKPEFYAIEEMKSRPFKNLRRSLCCLSSEENAGCEDTLETLHEAPVMETVLGQLQEFKHLGSAFEPNGPALLLHRERGHPDGDEAVLAEWDVPFIMHLPQ
jgi:hypothetical protein